MLYTKDKNDAVSSFNLIGAEDNILTTARPGEGDAVEFYTYTKDLRESTINVVGKDGTSQKTYSYTDYGETTEQGENNFYNEICYGGGVYDKTTGLYYLNARYYSPENGSFLTQDTYRGSRSKTSTHTMYLSRKCLYIIRVRRRRKMYRKRAQKSLCLVNHIGIRLWDTGRQF